MALAMPDEQESARAGANKLRVSAMQAARAFSDPLAYFSIQRLGVNLSQSFTLLENSEPFETNALVRYQVLDALFCVDENSANQGYGDKVVEFASLRGDIPDNPVAKEELEMWKAGALALNHAMGPHDAEPKTASYEGQHCVFSTSAFEASGALVDLCAGKISDTRALGYFISQLIFSSSEEATSHAQLPLDVFFCDWEKGETTLMKRRFMPVPKETAQKLLQFVEVLFTTVYTVPTPIYSSLIAELVPGKRRSESAAIVSQATPERFNDIVSALLRHQDEATASDEFVTKLLRDIHTLFDGDDAARALRNWQQSSGPFSADMVNNPYLKWLFPQGITWQDMPFVEGFALFAMVANASEEEKL
jgi:exodeoxyribonuclease V gamma subunit